MRKQTCGVYSLRSISIPNRIYIGSSLNIPRRWIHHKSTLRNHLHSSPILQHHFDKYGEEDLEFEIIESQEYLDNNHLLAREQMWMIRFRYKDTWKPYFNINEITGSNLGYKHTDEAKRKIGEGSKKWKRKPHTEESKQKMREHSATKGKPAWNKGISPKPESIAKRVAHTNYQTPSDEVRKKISDKLTGVPKSKESFEKRRKTMEGWVFPEESKKKVSESLKKTFEEHPELKEALRIFHTGLKQSKETIAKRVAKTKGKKHNLSPKERKRLSDQMKINRKNRWPTKD
jgi:group I intron endonuclease